MSTLRSTGRLFVPTLMTAAVVAACGGGGGGDPVSQLRQVPDAAKPADVSGGTTMNCVGGNANSWCSGDAVLRNDSGVRLTSSGVFVYGKSTTDNDLTPSDSTGLDPVVADTQALAEIRVHRSAANGPVDSAAMLLGDLGITWDGTTERPRIIEAFEPTTGVTELDVSGAVVTSRGLYGVGDPYYDYSSPPPAGTQSHYANNRYFGCAAASSCTPRETTGVSYIPGPFRTGGTDPDRTTAHRDHSDGDVRAGTPGGIVPSAGTNGSKGTRDLTIYSYLDANLAGWEIKETSYIDEWTPVVTPSLPGEQSTRRLGLVAFGNTTAPANVPTSGEATYRGIVYGWHTTSGTATPTPYQAAAEIVVNFTSASRQTDIHVTNAPGGSATPVSFVSRAAFGAPGTNVANYLAGTVDTGGTAALTGQLGARFFGSAAAEVAGSFVLKNAATGAATVGGFIARR